MTRALTVSLLISLACSGRCDGGIAREGFGRFGLVNEDGLLTLNVSPIGFETVPPNAPFKVRFADEGCTARPARVTSTEKVILLTGAGEGGPKSVRYTLLYPGFSAVFGTHAVLYLSGTTVAVEEPEPGPEDDFRWLLVTAREGQCVPLVISFRAGFAPSNWRLVDEGGTQRMEIESGETIGEVRFITPFGMQEFPSSASVKQKEALRKAAGEWAARGIPVFQFGISQYARNGGSVTFEEKFRSAEGEMIAPLPPVLLFAMEKGYPVSPQGELVRTGCMTRCGAFGFVRGDRLRYSLPVPPCDERGYVRAGGDGERLDLLREMVGGMDKDSASTAPDLAYAGVASAQMAWAFLDEETREALMKAWNQGLASAFLLPPYATPQPRKPWMTAAEPFTGLTYICTSGRVGPPPEEYRLDLQAGSALSLYGLYKYAQYSGNWEFVELKRHAVRGIRQYLELADDWAWMTVSSGNMGYGTGSGAAMTADYCGAVAGLKMARAIGDKSSEEYFASRAARVAVPTVARLWYTGWARERGLVPPNAVVLAFLERGVFEFAQLDEMSEDPWDATGLLSGQGVFPEIFYLYTAYARGALEDFEREFASRYRNWSDGQHAYPFPTAYGGNSVFVTFPHIYARAILGDPTRNLWNLVDAARSNRGKDSWMAPNVLAELLARETPLILTRWEPAGYRDGYVSQDGRAVVLEFIVSKPTEWLLAARVRKPFVPNHVAVNGEEAEFGFEQGILSLSRRVEGFVEVRIEF